MFNDNKFELIIYKQGALYSRHFFRQRLFSLHASIKTVKQHDKKMFLCWNFELSSVIEIDI